MQFVIKHLLFYSFAEGFFWNSVLNNELLFEEDCEAWAYGVVYRNVYDKFKKFKYNPLPYLEVNVELSKNEIDEYSCAVLPHKNIQYLNKILFSR